MFVCPGWSKTGVVDIGSQWGSSVSVPGVVIGSHGQDHRVLGGSSVYASLVVRDRGWGHRVRIIGSWGDQVCLCVRGGQRQGLGT